jgi:hypothetical protein
MLVDLIDIWSILRPFGLFYGHLVYFTAVWSILRPFGVRFLFLVCCTKKNLASHVPPQPSRQKTSYFSAPKSCLRLVHASQSCSDLESRFLLFFVSIIAF